MVLMPDKGIDRDKVQTTQGKTECSESLLTETRVGLNTFALCASISLSYICSGGSDRPENLHLHPLC